MKHLQKYSTRDLKIVAEKKICILTNEERAASKDQQTQQVKTRDLDQSQV